VQLQKPTIVIADDNEEVIRQVMLLLDHSYDLIGVCHDGEQALSAVTGLHPDVVVLDIAMPKLGGLQVVGRLQTLKTKSKIIMLTASEDQDLANGAIEAGAHGFVLKRRMHSDLQKAIDAVMHGAIFISQAS